MRFLTSQADPSAALSETILRNTIFYSVALLLRLEWKQSRVAARSLDYAQVDRDTIAQIQLSRYAFHYASWPTEGRADLLLLYVLYVCVLWRGEAGHLEI